MKTVDLFAGAGGFTTGAELAGCTVVWAANHWPAAVKIHAANHPHTVHACQDLQQTDWRTVPAHDLLLASPACQGHSPARGKEKPHHDALRSTAFAVISAVEHHRPPVFIVENVPEFEDWVLYRAWCLAAEALGYSLAPMVIDAANHGVPQHRCRLFIVGTRSKHPITLKLPQREHTPASAIVNFDAGKWSPIRTAKRSPATLRRIHQGRKDLGCGRFLIPYYSSGSGLTGRSLGRPIGTITTVDRWGVVRGNRMRMLRADEARAAMGFPADYQLPPQHKAAMHMLGNAVCPPVARDVITGIMEAA
ncbi:DNA cytosine methyltransferase [Variovorax sp. Root434]|uniref:DNA cytosine methyltransferase n=1 Tax=Variovorax sp. Root434 TaxID=1736536 RepID=UPI0006F3A065|nr:DNA cytosine methyltransferase [Variovorax sp. Root434]KQX34661.1 DNA methyltransferase [Variovorax sp. Root434]